MRRYGTVALLLAVTLWVLYIALAMTLPSHPLVSRSLVGLAIAAGVATMGVVVTRVGARIEAAVARKDVAQRARTLSVLHQVGMHDAG